MRNKNFFFTFFYLVSSIVHINDLYMKYNLYPIETLM